MLAFILQWIFYLPDDDAIYFVICSAITLL
jgi:hypothetical protein